MQQQQFINNFNQFNMFRTIISPILRSTDDRGSTVVKVLSYKSVGRWFDSSWGHWNFSLT